MPTQTEIDECQARCDALFKQKQQELEAMKALHQKLLNESKKQEKICDDCCEELYWSKKRESELCPNCDIDESDDEEDIVFCCVGCNKQIVRDSEGHDFAKCAEYVVTDTAGEKTYHEDWYCVNCPIPDEEEEEQGIHKTISDEEGILACKKVFEKMKGELVGKPLSPILF